MARFGGKDVTPARDDPPMPKDAPPKEVVEAARAAFDKKKPDTTLVAVDDNVVPIKGGAGKKHLTHPNLGGARDPFDCPQSLYPEPLPKKARIYRASTMGKCVTVLAGLAMGIEPAEMPESLQSALQAGIDNEPILLDLLRNNGYRSVTYAELEECKKLGLIAGWDPEEEQIQTRIFIGKKAVVRSHLDDLMVGSKAPVWTNDGIENLFDVEVKAFGDSLWDKWKKSGIDAFPDYQWQISARTLAHHLPCLFCVGHKDEDGIVTEIDIAIYYEPPIGDEKFFAKVEAADAIAKGGAPESLPDCDLDQWPCPLYFLPQHKGEKGKDLVTITDAALGELARAFYTASVDRKDADNLRNEVKGKLEKWYASHPQHKDHKVVVVDATGVNRFSVEWSVVEQPAKTIRAHTQSYPRVNLLQSDQE